MSPCFRYFILGSFLLLNQGLFAQEAGKIEFEKRVSKAQFPEQIIHELATFIDDARRIRYFQEFDGTQYFWEVKMVYNRRQVSIEYRADMSLLDVEVLESWSKVGPSIREPLSRFFDQNYKRFKITRIQQQFLPQPGQDIEPFITAVIKGYLPPAHAYELEAEVMGIETREFGFYEFLFDQNFHLIEKRKIIPLSDVNLHF